MRNLFRINYFDIVLNLFTSFGYFEKDSENYKSIKSISASIKKEGLCVLDYMNVKKEIQNLVPETSFACGSIQFKIKRFVVMNSINKEIEVIDNGTHYFFSEKVRAYGKNDLTRLFEENKLKVKYIFGDYALNPFDEKKSERLILVAKKE